MTSGKKKTHEEFVAEVIEIRGDIYDFLTEYKSSGDKIKIRHKKCGSVWETAPANLINKHGKGKIYCPFCHNNQKSSTEKFKRKVKTLVGDEYLVLGEYVNTNTPILMKHNIDGCGYEYEVRPSGFLHKDNRCPKCSGKMRKTTEQFKKEVYELVGDEYSVIGVYINAFTKIKMQHNKRDCDYVFEVTPHHFLTDGTRCLKCAEPKGEIRIRKWLENNNVEFISQKKFKGLVGTYGGNLSYDFYLHNQNMLIEYQGEFHDGNVRFQLTEKDIKRRKEHDKRKREYAKQYNIKLLEIWYWNYDNIEEILEKKISKYKEMDNIEEIK